MKLAAIILVFAIISGYIISQRFGSEPIDEPGQAAVTQSNPAAQKKAADLQRENAELITRVARLEQQMQVLMDGLDEPTTTTRNLALNGLANADEEDATPAVEAEPQFPRPRGGVARDATARVARLEEVGFASDQAALIVAREQEMQIAALNERWDRRRATYLEDPEQFDLSKSNPLRGELGERDYERYLEANNRPTNVPVGQLFEGSPAAIAGLQTGDQIITYDGKRIFNLNELNQVSVQGNKGEPVLIDVMRDGNRMQLPIERGPLGISVRRGRRGF